MDLDMMERHHRPSIEVEYAFVPLTSHSKRGARPASSLCSTSLLLRWESLRSMRAIIPAIQSTILSVWWMIKETAWKLLLQSSCSSQGEGPSNARRTRDDLVFLTAVGGGRGKLEGIGRSFQVRQYCS